MLVVLVVVPVVLDRRRGRLLDGVVAGGPPGASTLRVWWARLEPGGELTAHEHSELRWVAAEELEALDWIPADRPLLPAVRALLARL